MEAGYQVGQVVLQGSMDLQEQWQSHLEQFRAALDAGFDIYCWAHHYLIHPFQHFQPWPVLARLAAEAGDMKLATSVLLLPLLTPWMWPSRWQRWTTSAKAGSSWVWVWDTARKNVKLLAHGCRKGVGAVLKPWNS